MSLKMICKKHLAVVMYIVIVVVIFTSHITHASITCPEVKPIAHCQEILQNGTILVWWGYENNDVDDIGVAIGEMNFFSPPPAGRGQPTLFIPGLVQGKFYTIHDPVQLNNTSWTVQVTGPPLTAEADVDVLAECIGACCAIEDEICHEITEAECEMYPSSEWQGLFTTCDDNICNYDMGACCMSNGSCTIATEPQCENIIGGVYQGDNTTCGENGCGACCGCIDDCYDNMVQDSCDMMLPSTFLPGQTCNDLNVSCPFVGACCGPNGTCMDSLTRTECEIAGGIFLEICTVCNNQSCVFDPTSAPTTLPTPTPAPTSSPTSEPTSSPTPEIISACCNPEFKGFCLDLPVINCTSSGGNPGAPGVLCKDTTCGSCCNCTAGCTDAIPSTIKPLCPGVDIWRDALCDDLERLPCEDTGACCITPEEVVRSSEQQTQCVDSVTASECVALSIGASYQGNCTICSEIACIG